MAVLVWNALPGVEKRSKVGEQKRSSLDSSVEGTGFEISVPRYRRWFRGSPRYAIRAEQRVASEFVSIHCSENLDSTSG